jgi:rhodanese-related sulfurtransferase
MRRFIPFVVAGSALIAACGGSSDGAVAVVDTAAESGASAGLVHVAATEAASIIDNPPADLVILDVRTQEEFDEGHIEGAVMLDFYREDFAAELAKLDPDVPYVLYCRSGNRSGRTIELMEGLEFQNVSDVEGGIIGWLDADLPIVTD